MRQSHVARRIRTTALVVLSLVVLTFSGYEGSAPVEAAAQEQEALRIEVVLDEYSFSPDPLRIPAGRPVTLVIRNVGTRWFRGRPRWRECSASRGIRSSWPPACSAWCTWS